MRNLFKSILTGSLILVAGAAFAQQNQPNTRAPQAQTAPQVQQEAAPLAGKIDEGSPLGIWVTEDGKSRVQISDCGGTLCATIIWLRDPNDKHGRPWTDQLNKQVSLRTRPIIGLGLFRNMRPAGQLAWKGRIYNPEDGDSYDVTVTLARADRLTIKGCVLFVCETHHWTR